MPRVTSDESLKRMMKFLAASNEPSIAIKLATRGFRNEDRQEGWALLDKACGRHIDMSPNNGRGVANYNVVIEKVDDWENTWFDVAGGALKRLSPQDHEILFKNLSKTSGPEVLLTVRMFLKRLEELEQKSDDQTQAALAELQRRGLTEACKAEVEDLLRQVEVQPETPAPPTQEDLDAITAEKEAAFKEMWAWFLDWSGTARTVIKNKNDRVMLGLSAPHGKSNYSTEASDTGDMSVPAEADESN